MIRLYLEDRNHTVTVARDGNTGLRKSSAESWDPIILDLRLPGIHDLDNAKGKTSPIKGLSYLLAVQRVLGGGCSANFP